MTSPLFMTDDKLEKTKKMVLPNAMVAFYAKETPELPVKLTFEFDELITTLYIRSFIADPSSHLLVSGEITIDDESKLDLISLDRIKVKAMIDLALDTELHPCIFVMTMPFGVVKINLDTK